MYFLLTFICIFYKYKIQKRDLNTPVVWVIFLLQFFFFVLKYYDPETKSFFTWTI